MQPYTICLTGGVARNPLVRLAAPASASFPVSNIRNKYVAKVKPGEHSLVIPLGAKAEINIEKNTSDIPTGIYKLELMDISGITWKTDIAKE